MVSLRAYSELKMKEYESYDLHAHGYTNWGRGKFSLERTPRTPKYILDAVRKARLDGIVLVNAGDSGVWKNAYEEFSETSKDKEKRGGYKLIKELKNALIFEDKKGLLKIIKGQEIITEGHILAIGLNYGKIVPSRLELKDALQKIRNYGCVSDAAHPFGTLGIGRKNLEKYKELIDVFELNMNYQHFLLKPLLGINPSIQEADKLAEQLGINWVAVSDCHEWENVGNGHIKVKESLVDFSSADNLKDSLRETLRKGNFLRVSRKSNPLITSVLKHMLILSYDFYIRNKFGWINLEGF